MNLGSLFVFVTLLVTSLLVIPVTVLQMTDTGTGRAHQQVETVSLLALEDASDFNVSVYRTRTSQIERVPLELYIAGVVASEMPAEFELEALKAQALAARTYLIRRMVERDFSDTPEGAWVVDTEQHQVYQNNDELMERWGADYTAYMNKIISAVIDTQGLVLTYEGRPIQATYFSTSNGFTEHSEDYWGTALPYLQSVPSPWDFISPRYTEQQSFSIDELIAQLQLSEAMPVSAAGTSYLAILSRTEGNRVRQARIGNQHFSGKEIREALGLSSSDFRWQLQDNRVIIQTLGWGHGVGLSQWGAHGMAQEGATAKEIVKHYYQGIEVQDYRSWIVK
jgi:stage II sporulation protein D